MKYLALVLALAVGVRADAPVVRDQFPSNGEQLLSGTKMWAKIMAHKCSDGDCKHYSVEDLSRGVAAFDYLKGYFFGFRTAQIALKQKAIVFPEEGVDCQTLISPLIEFIEKREKLASEHASLVIFFFLRERFPSPQ